MADNDRAGLLRDAVEKGDSSKLERLIKSISPGDVRIFLAQPKDDATPLMVAAKDGNTAMAKILLAHGAEVNARVEAHSAIHYAVSYARSLEMVKTLANAGADLKTDFYGETLLMAAAGVGALDISKWLVEQGADLHLQNPARGMTALDYANTSKQKDIIDYLKSLGVKEARADARALAKFLAKKFGGKPVEHFHGFAVNARFAGYKCQFHLDSKAAGIVVHQLKYRAPELRLSSSFHLLLNQSEPALTKSKAIEVKRISQKIGIRVWKLNELVTDDFVSKLCEQNLALLQNLKLTGADSLRLGGQAMSFGWSSLEPKAAVEKLRAFEALLEGFCRSPQQVRQLFDNQWLFKPAPKSTASKHRHSFGGKMDRPVACSRCGAASNLIAQIDLADDSFGKPAVLTKTLPILWCLTCMEWEPAFYDFSSEPMTPLNQKGEPVRLDKVESGEDDLPERAAMLSPIPAGKKSSRKTKVGGAPDWIQLDATPDCPKCENAMTFVAQFASDKHIAFADMGLLYTFVCPECKIVATLLQSN